MGTAAKACVAWRYHAQRSVTLPAYEVVVVGTDGVSRVVFKGPHVGARRLYDQLDGPLHLGEIAGVGIRERRMGN